jgi:UDP:flavonoid glycosyltransferase YjiC (YdhE family)
VVAHETGLAQAQVGISLAAIEFDVSAMVAPIIDQFASGLAAATASAPYLSAFPPSLDPSRWPDTRRFRLRAARSRAGRLRAARSRAAQADPAPTIPSTAQPLVYMTFGTVLGHLPEATGVYRTALEAVAGLPARVLLTVGRAIDPRRLGPLPENTRVEQWVSQEDVMREAAAVVCHGGSGTTFGSLAAGVPVVVCPLFADHSQNGQAVQDAGAGVLVSSAAAPVGGLRILQPDDVAALRQAVEDVLNRPAYRDAAIRIASELAAMPTVDEVVSRLLQEASGTG